MISQPKLAEPSPYLQQREALYILKIYKPSTLGALPLSPPPPKKKKNKPRFESPQMIVGQRL